MSLEYRISQTQSPESLLDIQKLPLERITYYLDYQRDPIIGTQTGRCRFEQADWGWKMVSSLPMQVDFPRDANDLAIDWDDVPEEQAQTSALWRLSIGYLPTLLESANDIDLINKTLESFWQYLGTDAWAERSLWMSSLDHALAIRIRAIVTLKCMYDAAEEPLPSAAISILVNDIENIIEDQDGYFPVNNHGAMVAIALIHAAAAIPEVDEYVRDRHGLALMPLATHRLKGILDFVFDDHGIAGENSPEYQRYWLSLISPLSALVREWEIRAVVAAGFDVEQLTVAAKDALMLFVDENQRMLSIGDSHPRLVSSPSATDVSLVSQRQGFAIWKSGRTFVTFNCGYTSYAHKHGDDSSITLTYLGKNLILDSGFYSHDWNDPRVIYTKSQNAHSGVFLKKLDYLHPGKLYWPGRERIKASMIREEGDAFSVLGKVVIDDSLRINRRVVARSERLIELVDSIEGDFGEHGVAVARFILPFGAGVSVYGDTVDVSFEGVRMQLIFSGLDDSRRIQVDSGVVEPGFSGWVSPDLSQLVPAVCIEVTLPYGRPVVTSIVLSNEPTSV